MKLVKIMSSNADVRLLITTRAVRLFSYGSVSVILALYVRDIGFSGQELGLLLSLISLGDAAVSLYITVNADRLGRRWMLVIGTVLKIFAGLVFAFVATPTVLHYVLLVTAGTLGVISSTGNEVGPFMALEQAILAEKISPQQRTTAFAWYNLVGYVFSGLGSVESGRLTDVLQHGLFSRLDSFRVVFLQYSGLALLLSVLFGCLTNGVEAQPPPAIGGADQTRIEPDPVTEDVQEQLVAPLLDSESQREIPVKIFLGLSHASLRKVVRLASLLAVDSFAGSLINGTLLAYYFAYTYSVSTTYLGILLFTANVIAGCSSLLSGFIARKFGLVNTMVFTHLPSNILTMLIPLMPNLQAATATVFLRFSISQMDVAPRQSYVAGVVNADERTASMGITNIAKSLASSLGPLLTGWLIQLEQFQVAFFLCGGLKIVYDLILLYSFSHIKPDVEQ